MKNIQFIENKIGKTKIAILVIKMALKPVSNMKEPEIFQLKLPLKGCSIDENEVIIVNGDGLQGFAEIVIVKDKKAFKMSREKNKEGYDAYEREYGKHTKIYSVCKEDKDIRESFKLSLGGMWIT